MFEDELIQIKPEAYKALTPTKIFRDITNKMTDLSYSDDGKSLIVSASDVILLYDLNDGTKVKNIECMKYGVGVVEYADKEYCLHSSTKCDNLIRLLSLQKKSYLRYFPGHTKSVNGIAKNPQDETTFLTSSHDQTIRMWDRRTYENVGFLNINNIPLIAYDPEGILFAVATKNESIKLFDVRSFDLGPFKTCTIEKTDEMEEWIGLEFSLCGKFILVSTNGAGVKWIDAFEGTLVHNFNSHHNRTNLPLRATISPDSSCVIVGSTDRHVYFYSTDTGSLLCRKPYNQPAHVVSFNEKQFMMTALSEEIVLWAPSEDYNDLKK